MPEVPQPGRRPSPVADGRDRSLDPKSIVASRISAAIWLLVLAVPLGIAAVSSLLWTGFAGVTLLGVGVGALAFLGFALLCLWWPAVR